jgi:hypothetical protein
MVARMPRKQILNESERLEILNWLASQENGIRFLQWLCHDVCNYQVTSVGYDNGALSPYMTLFNEARKDIWRLIRPYLLAHFVGMIESIDVRMNQEALQELAAEQEVERSTENEEA